MWCGVVYRLVFMKLWYLWWYNFWPLWRMCHRVALTCVMEWYDRKQFTLEYVPLHVRFDFVLYWGSCWVMQNVLCHVHLKCSFLCVWWNANMMTVGTRQMKKWWLSSNTGLQSDCRKKCIRYVDSFVSIVNVTFSVLTWQTIVLSVIVNLWKAVNELKHDWKIL